MTNNELKLKRYGEYLSDLERLDLNEARCIYKAYLISDDPKEQEKLRIKLIEGTMYLVYEFLKDNVLGLFNSCSYDMDDIIGFSHEYLIQKIDSGFFGTDKTFADIFVRGKYFGDLKKQLLGEKISVQNNTFFTIDNLIDLLVDLINNYQDDFISFEDFLRKCLDENHIQIREIDNQGNIVYKNKTHAYITIGIIRHNYEILGHIFKLLKEKNVKLDKENITKYLLFLLNYAIEKDSFSENSPMQINSEDLIDSVYLNQILELYYNDELTQAEFTLLKNYFGFDGSLKKSYASKAPNQNFTWEEYYKFAKAYYDKYNNLNVDYDFKTNDGINYDVNGAVHLGHWIHGQKYNTDPESERGILLKKIGIDFSKKYISFYEMLDYLLIYKSQNKSVKIKENFRTNDGFTYDPNGRIGLGNWLALAKLRIDPNSEEGIILADLGVDFEENKRKKFEYGFDFAKDFYINKGHLRVQKFDVYKDFNLGYWIKNKRRTIDKNSDYGKMLTSIGMIWSYKENLTLVKEICMQYLIPYEKNKKLLENISVQELISKIEYLKDIAEEIVDRNGILHEVFYLSFYELKSKYNVTPDELIKKYYLNDDGRKKSIR